MIEILMILTWFSLFLWWLEEEDPENGLRFKKNDNGEEYLMFLGVRVQDMINPVKWWSFVMGIVMEYYLQPHILEQVLIRQIVCQSPCMENGKCYDCGCKMPEKTYVFNEMCSQGKWGKVIKDKEEYLKIKQEYKFQLKIDYGQQSI